MKSYCALIKHIYETIRLTDDITADLILDLVRQLNAVLPEETINTSKVKIAFSQDGTCVGKLSGWNAATWYPNVGEDPDMPPWKQDDQNGYYIPNDVKQNFIFNDIIKVNGWTGSQNSDRIRFESAYLKSDHLGMSINDFWPEAEKMVKGYLVGRFMFNIRTCGLGIKPLEAK